MFFAMLGMTAIVWFYCIKCSKGLKQWSIFAFSRGTLHIYVKTQRN